MTDIRILLVEDNPVDRKIIQKMLKGKYAAGLGLAITSEWTDSLAGSLKHLKAGAFDLVLLDLGLTDSWGIETYDKICSKYPDVPVFIISSMNDESIAFMAVERGARKYLVKGMVESEDLLSCIAKAAGVS